MSNNFSNSNGGYEGNRSLNIVIIVAVVAVLVSIGILVAGIFLQGDKIKSENEVNDYILDNGWWDAFNRDIPPMISTDAPITVGDKRYFVGVFVETIEDGLMYKYLVDSDGIVYYLDENKEVKPLDKNNQKNMLIGLKVEDVKVSTVADAINLVLKEGYSLPDEMDQSSAPRDTVIIDGKLHYRVDISYPAKDDKPAYVDKLHILEDGTVLVEDENGGLKPAYFYGLPETETSESDSSSEGSSSSSSTSESSSMSGASSSSFTSDSSSMSESSSLSSTSESSSVSESNSASSESSSN